MKKREAKEETKLNELESTKESLEAQIEDSKGDQELLSKRKISG